MESWQVARVLKRDALGRVELLVGPGGRCVRRVACGSRVPFSRWVGRLLLARERRALGALQGVAGVPRLIEDAESKAQGAGRRSELLRSWIEALPLSETRELPIDFFDRLDELVLSLHAQGVCHNDLHKEQNVLVDGDGFPWLVDFQLASRHQAGGMLFQSRVRDDLRHVEKHRRRYTRDGRAPGGGSEPLRGRGQGIARSFLARAWRRAAKPAYHFLTRRVLGWSDGEPRRPSTGPWPRWTPALGARPAPEESPTPDRG